MEKVTSDQISIIGVVSEAENEEKLKEYLNMAGCSKLKVARVPNSVIYEYKFSRTPTTLLVSKEGIVESIWLGRWTPQLLSEVEAKLGLNT